jgi:hypothetical protein
MIQEKLILPVTYRPTTTVRGSRNAFRGSLFWLKNRKNGNPKKKVKHGPPKVFQMGEMMQNES